MSSKRLERDPRSTSRATWTATRLPARSRWSRASGKVVHFEAQGFRYKEENAPMQKDTIFSLMSMTKPIVSTALMMLWEEGRVHARRSDFEVAAVLREQAGDGERARCVKARPVTVRHILTHTSGLSLAAARRRRSAGGRRRAAAEIEGAARPPR